MSFTISEISRTGTEVVYGLYLDPLADPGSDGIGSFQLILDFDPLALSFIPGSLTYASGFLGASDEDDAALGIVSLGAFTFPNWTSFGDPLITFKFDIAAATASEDLLLDEIYLDDILQPDNNLTVLTGNNADPTGSVTISGTVAEDAMLTASDDLADTDGISGPITYTWYASGSASPLGTGATYTLTQSEVGKTITVVASYTDDGGTAESVASDPTTAVTNVNDAPVDFTVGISGVVAEGNELTATASVTSDEDGLPFLPAGFSYQWQQSIDGSVWNDIDGATSTTFTPGEDEIGRLLRVQASYTDQQGTAESTESSATTAVNGAPDGTVTISGILEEGQALTASDNLTDADGIPGSITYTWYASGSGTPLDTGATYTLTQAEVGRTITVVASYTDGQGKSESVFSDATTAIANVNDEPTGFSVSISGTAEEDTLLTASASVNSDEDGLPALPEGFSYQWQSSGNGADWTDIDGATATTFTPGDSQVGEFLRVSVSYLDNQGTTESKQSAPTLAVTNVNDEPSGDVLIAGTADEGQTLTASNTLLDADGFPGVVTYTWFASGSVTPLGTGPTYTLTQAEVGRTITVVASYTDGQGTEESVPSDPTAVVSNINDAPVDFTVSISGAAAEGTELTASADVTSDEDGLPSLPDGFSYQWQSSQDGSIWTDIQGATGATFTPDDAEVDRFIQVIASYTDLQGSEESATSAATAAVTNINDDPLNFSVDITGSKSEGQTLTAVVGEVTDEDGVGTLVYQWQRSNDSDGFDDIGGATGTAYVLVADDVGRQLRLQVSYVDGQGTTETALSAATSVITNTNDLPDGLPQLTGTFEEGQTVSIDLSEISDGDGLPGPEGFAFQWQHSDNGGASWSTIAGATAQSRLLTDEDSGRLIRAVVTYTDNNGTEESLPSAGQTVSNVNDDPEGSVTISGTPSEGQVLTASDTLSDEDGLGPITYTWFASGSATPIGFGPTYTLTQAEVGRTITVTASYTDGQGKAESVPSDPTTPVTNVNNDPDGSVLVTGTLEEDQTLTVSDSLSDEDGLGTITYTWYASGSDTPLGTGTTLLLTQAEVGKTITAVASYTDQAGNPESVPSAETSAVVNLNDLPDGTVTITGINAAGELLTASNDLTDEDGLGPITYTWYASGSATPLATGDTYLLTQAEAGKTITVEASYTDGQGTTESVPSDPTATIADFNTPPTGIVIITGTAEVGGTLLVFNNLADANGLGSLSYQWFADDVAIDGATGTSYQPTQTDSGKAIVVTASYTDGQGYLESVSSEPTLPVDGGFDPTGDLIEGTSGPDVLVGGDLNDTIVGFEGRDTLTGNGGDDVLQGGDDIDTASYAGDILDYSWVRDGSDVEITGPAVEGTDTLIDVERVDFNDLSVAFDLDGHAGQVAKLLGTVIGKDDWYNRDFVGIGLNILDQPEFSFEILMEAALDVVLGLNRSNADVVNMLFINLIGVAPSQTDLNNLVSSLNKGDFTQVELSIAAAEHPINLFNIGLTGLIETGLEYVPLI